VVEGDVASITTRGEYGDDIIAWKLSDVSSEVSGKRFFSRNVFISDFAFEGESADMDKDDSAISSLPGVKPEERLNVRRTGSVEDGE